MLLIDVAVDGSTVMMNGGRETKKTEKRGSRPTQQSEQNIKNEKRRRSGNDKRKERMMLG